MGLPSASTRKAGASFSVVFGVDAITAMAPSTAIRPEARPNNRVIALMSSSLVLQRFKVPLSAHTDGISILRNKVMTYLDIGHRPHLAAVTYPSSGERI